MQRPRRIDLTASVAALACAVTLAACEPGENDPGPGGVTVGEARALDEAAEMLEQRQLPEGALEAEEPGQTTDERTPAE